VSYETPLYQVLKGSKLSSPVPYSGGQQEEGPQEEGPREGGLQKELPEPDPELLILIRIRILQNHRDRIRIRNTVRTGTDNYLPYILYRYRYFIENMMHCTIPVPLLLQIMTEYVAHNIEWRLKLFSVQSAVAELLNDIHILGRRIIETCR